MNTTNLSDWLKYINVWVQIECEPITNKVELKRARFVDFKFGFLDTKSKNILLKKDNVELLTMQYNHENNLTILKQLNPIMTTKLNSGIYFYYDDYFLQKKLLINI